MKFAKITYWLAAIYGILVLLPGFFLEAEFSRTSPPALTHPEFYYGFYGSALVWQLAFILIARDPVRYRPLMLVSVLEKAGFRFEGIRRQNAWFTGAFHDFRSFARLRSDTLEG